MTRRIRVLVADDSPVCLAAVRLALEEVRGFELVGEARDGRAAAELTGRVAPEVIVMDVRMPGMNGLDAVERIMADTPTPILVLSGDPAARTGALAYEALRRGAIDLLAKDDLAVSWTSRALLRDRIRFLSTVPVVRHLRPRREWHPPRTPRRRRSEVLALVASTGGPAALADVLGALPANFDAAILIVQHLRPGFVTGLASWLDAASPLEVRVAHDGARLVPGVAMLAPDSAHLGVASNGRVTLHRPSPCAGHVPSGDALLRSLAKHFRERAAGVVMTGMGDDGAAGLHELHRVGGTTFVQDESTSAVYGMPRAALRLEPGHQELPLSAIAGAIVDAQIGESP